MTHVGLISDTHGIIRPEAVEALRGSELIIHAGDVGAPEVLDHLRAIAPTMAVRGNVDSDRWGRSLPFSEVVRAGDVRIYVLHDVSELDFDPRAAGYAAVISGHSHRFSAEHRDGVLFLNPGGAGPRRFALPLTVARLLVDGTSLAHERVELRLRDK
jgi:putative phosphoesterase